jgi:hypothetical protein
MTEMGEMVVLGSLYPYLQGLHIPRLPPYIFPKRLNHRGKMVQFLALDGHGPFMKKLLLDTSSRWCHVSPWAPSSSFESQTRKPSDHNFKTKIAKHSWSRNRNASSTISMDVTTHHWSPNHQVLAHQPLSWLWSTLFTLSSHVHLLVDVAKFLPSMVHPLALGPSLHVHPSLLPIQWHELAWPSPLSLTISTLKIYISQDKRHVAHTTTHTMVSLNTKPKLDHLLSITHHPTHAHISTMLVTSLVQIKIDDLLLP